MRFVAFRYVVTLEDRDEDGLSIGADALDAGGGTIESANGVEADLSIGDHTISDDGDHLVLGSPPEAACADQRELALTHTPIVVSAWDGTPFRVDIIRNFPDFVTDARSRTVARSDRPTRGSDRSPVGIPDRRNGRFDRRSRRCAGRTGIRDYERYWRDRLLVSGARRTPGLSISMTTTKRGATWVDHGMSAHLCCGTTSYNKRSARTDVDGRGSLLSG